MKQIEDLIKIPLLLQPVWFIIEEKIWVSRFYGTSTYSSDPTHRLDGCCEGFIDNVGYLKHIHQLEQHLWLT